VIVSKVLTVLRNERTTVGFLSVLST